MYSIILVLCASILVLVDVMAGAPFKSMDMRDAYYYGCELGSKPLTDDKVLKCAIAADTFKDTLDDIDVQMEKISEHSK
jgi:hypothetical protein